MNATEDIRRAVYQALTADPMIDADDIEVDVSPEGLLLNGTVPSQEQASKATVTATGVPGVAQVRNLLAVALPSQDYGDDAALADEANDALAANTAVPPAVHATSRQGGITLTGTVSTTAQKIAAKNTVASVGGVLSIINKIVVTGE